MFKPKDSGFLGDSPTTRPSKLKEQKKGNLFFFWHENTITGINMDDDASTIHLNSDVYIYIYIYYTCGAYISIVCTYVIYVWHMLVCVYIYSVRI